MTEKSHCLKLSLCAEREERLVQKHYSLQICWLVMFWAYQMRFNRGVSVLWFTVGVSIESVACIVSTQFEALKKSYKQGWLKLTNTLFENAVLCLRRFLLFKLNGLMHHNSLTLGVICLNCVIPVILTFIFHKLNQGH